MKSHLQSYPCPHQINSFWNLGFLLGITIILQIITGIFLGLHYTSDLNSAYSSVFFFIREIYYGLEPKDKSLMKTISWKTKGGDYKFIKVKIQDVLIHRKDR